MKDCAVTGCGTFQWCDATGTHLCKAGCEKHDECKSAEFCKVSTHTCERTSSYSGGPGFTYYAMCSDGTSYYLNSSLPSGTTVKATCPAGTTGRGGFYCSISTYVCVPND